MEFTADGISSNELSRDTDTSRTGNIDNTANINILYDAWNGTPIWDIGIPQNSNEMGDGIHTVRNEIKEETINESITLDSCISLGNSGIETMANKLKDSGKNREAKLTETGVNELAKRQTVTIQDANTDSDDSEDENMLVHSLDLGSNITIGSEMEKSARVTEWDATKITGIRRIGTFDNVDEMR